MIPRRFRSPYLFLAVPVLIAVAGFLVLRAGYETVKPEEAPRPVVAVGESVIALRDGSTIIAERGSLGREMADWLNQGHRGEAKFLVAGDPFEPGSTAPTRESEARISSFIAMMKANRGVSARIAIFADDSAGGPALAAQRAERMRALLVSRGVSPRRLTVEAQPAAMMLAPAGQDSPVHGGQVVIVLNRRG